MKKMSKYLVIILLLSSFTLPFLPVAASVEPKTAAIDTYRVPLAGKTGDWDFIVSDWYNNLYATMFNVLDWIWGTNVLYTAGVDNPVDEEWIPLLATNWTFYSHPSEKNDLGFNNTGGIAAVDITLREGVQFHDGSYLNATVVKFNIDRLQVINGNLTGRGDLRWLNSWWVETDDTEPFFTENWNLSSYAADPLIFPDVPSVDDYGGYWINDTHELKNPRPFGGYDGTTPIHYAPYNRYPVIRQVKILKDKPQGGTVRIISNSWNSNGANGNTPCISYQAYKDFWDRGFYGFKEDDPKYPDQIGIPHMIGTGPYKFDSYDETGRAGGAGGGTYVKNENYWNASDLEYEGWFDADVVEAINFPAGPGGAEAKSTAFLTHAIDYSSHYSNMPIDWDAVKADSNILTWDDLDSQYITQICMNGIGETWWAWENTTVDTYYGREAFGKGVPRVLREAINYAFDYDLLIETGLNNEVVRSGGPLCTTMVYYNQTVADMYLPDFDLEYARTLLLTTEDDNFTVGTPVNYSKECADRGLTMADVADNSVNNAKWQDVASDDPLPVGEHSLFNFMWDDWHLELKSVLETSLANIGIKLNPDPSYKVSTFIWDYLETYWTGTFNMWEIDAFVMDFDMPREIGEGWIASNYQDPGHGDWRNGSVSDATWPEWNFGFNYDDEIDDYVDRALMSAPPGRKKWLNKLAIKAMTETFPMAWVYHTKVKLALWKDWETWFTIGRTGMEETYWGGGPSWHFLRYVGLEKDYPLISGSPLIIIATVSTVSMLGVIYTLMRKKKLRKN